MRVAARRPHAFVEQRALVREQVADDIADRKARNQRSYDRARFRGGRIEQLVNHVQATFDQFAQPTD